MPGATHCLIVLIQGLSLNLELDWQPKKCPIDPPVSALYSSRVVGGWPSCNVLCGCSDKLSPQACTSVLSLSHLPSLWHPFGKELVIWKCYINAGVRDCLSLLNDVAFDPRLDKVVL